MPRLSVIAGGIILTVIALASLNAHARVAVRSIADLQSDPKVMALQHDFHIHAASSVLFEKCTQFYGTTMDQLNYHKAKYAEVTKAYADSYFYAYYEKVGAPAPKNIIDYYMQYIANEKQTAINNTDAILQKRGCQKSELKKLYSTVEDMRKADLAAKNKNTKKQDPWAIQPVQAPTTPAPAAASQAAPVAAPQPTN